VLLLLPRFPLLTMLKEGLEGFIEDHCLTRGAAIAFYAATALAPVLFIATAIAGIVLGQQAASGAVGAQLRLIMNPESAELVQLAIMRARGADLSLLGSLLGITFVVVTASVVFTEMEDALNVIWKAPRKESYIYQVLRGRVLSLILVVGLGILLIVSMILASAIGSVGKYLERYTTLSDVTVDLLNFGLGFSLLSALFAAIYKLLPNKRLYWRDVLAGACGTALMFQGGQALVTFYLTNLISADMYGAAAGLILLMLWIYFAAMIFLLGAEFTKAWVRHCGRRGIFTAPPAGPGTVPAMPRNDPLPSPPPGTSAAPDADPAPRHDRAHTAPPG
jgi:membrane protein